MPQKILFLVPYPIQESPSQRFRFEQYFKILEKNKHPFSIQSFLTQGNWHIFFNQGHLAEKIFALVAGFSKRFFVLLRAPFYEIIFIHREVAPIGPPVFEWILAKILRKKIVYDFDDAIWLTDRLKESRLVRFLKWRGKVGSICKWSYKVSCGNEYLADFALKHNNQVIYNPTTIDTENWHNPNLYNKSPHVGDPVVIGWTGSHSTLKYLIDIEAVLQKLELKFPMIQILIIADRKPILKLKSLVFLPWVEKTEIEDLLKIDIGIMPLPNDEWTKGKCGFKALQYMALKIPAVASPVDVNSKIIDNGVNGFLCNSEEEWEAALTKLIENATLRNQMGEQGRKKVIDQYSVMSNSDNFLSLFE